MRSTVLRSPVCVSGTLVGLILVAGSPENSNDGPTISKSEQAIVHGTDSRAQPLPGAHGRALCGFEHVPRYRHRVRVVDAERSDAGHDHCNLVCEPAELAAGSCRQDCGAPAGRYCDGRGTSPRL